MTILHIDSSINGENSATRALTKSIVDQIQKAQWGEAVIHRDLAASPLPPSPTTSTSRKSSAPTRW